MLIGANNSLPRDPRHEGDRGVLLCLNEATGELQWQLVVPRIGPRIFHSTWSSPSLGEAGGRPLVFFGGGDGVCYAFEPLSAMPHFDAAAALKRVWRFDCDPTAPKEDVHRYIKNLRESPSNIMGMPVFYKNRIYVTAGGDIWWGKKKAWLKCIDATGSGDITETGELWSAPLERHSCSTPSIADGLVFVGDCAGLVHCIDAETGEEYWTHKLGQEIWGSTLVADGKVYAGSRSGDFAVLAAAKEKQVLAEMRFDAAIASTPAAANGVLYIATLENLYAFSVREGV